jgi:hypothetical protein
MASRAASESEVVAYLRELEPDLADLSLWTRNLVLETDRDLSERIYRGWRGVGYHHPEAGYVCAIYPRTGEVQLLFEHGASLPDPEGLLQGEGTQTRTLHVTSSSPRMKRAIATLLQQAVAQRLLFR